MRRKATDTVEVVNPKNTAETWIMNWQQAADGGYCPASERELLGGRKTYEPSVEALETARAAQAEAAGEEKPEPAARKKAARNKTAAGG